MEETFVRQPAYVSVSPLLEEVGEEVEVRGWRVVRLDKITHEEIRELAIVRMSQDLHGWTVRWTDDYVSKMLGRNLTERQAVHLASSFVLQFKKTGSV